MKIEGRNAVREAVLSGVTIEKVVASKGVHDKVFNDLIILLKDKGIKVQFVDSAVMQKTSTTKNHQGIIAYAGEFEYDSVDDILEVAKQKGQDPFVLILDGIEDPHNFGSIIRVAECMGVHGIIISKNRACPVTETVIKVSTGATSYVKIARVTNINQEIEYLKQQNIWVYAVELGGESLEKSNLTGAIGLVIGSEGKGVSELTKKLCDGTLTISMYGKINSLNASVACGIALYEASKQRNK